MDLAVNSIPIPQTRKTHSQNWLDWLRVINTSIIPVICKLWGSSRQSRYSLHACEIASIFALEPAKTSLLTYNSDSRRRHFNIVFILDLLHIQQNLLCYSTNVLLPFNRSCCFQLLLGSPASSTTQCKNEVLCKEYSLDPSAVGKCFNFIERQVPDQTTDALPLVNMNMKKEYCSKPKMPLPVRAHKAYISRQVMPFSEKLYQTSHFLIRSSNY